MKFFPLDLTRDSRVTFYRPKPDAEIIPYRMNFGPGICQEYKVVPATAPLGEVPGERRLWYSGAPLEDFDGLGSCIIPSRWFDGSPGPGADFDVEACCGCPTVFLDDFQDANNTALTSHIHPVGPPWVAWTGITGFQIKSPSGPPSGYATGILPTSGEWRNYVMLSSGDVRIQANWQSPDHFDSPSIFFRLSDLTHWWLVAIAPIPGTVFLFKLNGATFTTEATASITYGSGTHNFKIETIGGQIDVWYDKTNVISYFDTFNETATGVGIRDAQQVGPTHAGMRWTFLEVCNLA